MARAFSLLVRVLLVIAVSGCTDSPAGTESPSTPAPTPVGSSPSSSPTAWTRYTSERFGFSLELPGEWRYRPATEDWPPGEYPAGGSAYIDNFEQPPAPFPTVDIVTQPLPDGLTRDTFLAWLDERNAEICTIEETDDITVDGTDARLQRQTCGYNAWEVAAFDAERVYLIYWLGEPSQIEADWRIFEQVIASFRFG